MEYVIRCVRIYACTYLLNMLQVDRHVVFGVARSCRYMTILATRMGSERIFTAGKVKDILNKIHTTSQDAR